MNITDVKEKFATLIDDMRNEHIDVTADVLTPEEAIGTPERDDLALVRGKERIVEAHFKGHVGHAFTIAPGSFSGTLQDVLDLNMNDDTERAIFIATVNAVMSYLGLIKDTRHCHDDVPMQCGEKLAEHLKKYHNGKKIGLIGYQPGMVKALAPDVIVSDKNPLNIGEEKFGVVVRDADDNEAIIRECDVVCVTGSTIANNTLFDILALCERHGTHPIFFGVSIKGAGKLLGLDTFCPMARSGVD